MNVIVIKTKDEPDIFKGGAPDHTTAFNIALKACMNIVEKDPGKMIHYDLETGWPTVITKEQNEKKLALFESIRSKIGKEIPGKVIFFGTGGNIETSNFEDIFKHKKI